MSCAARGGDVAAAGFRAFFNSATSEWIEYTAVGADGGEDLVRFNWRSLPGGAITEHLHPHQEERFIITAGAARFTLDGERGDIGVYLGSGGGATEPACSWSGSYTTS